MKKSEQKTSWQKSVSKTKLKSFSVICWYNTQIGCVGRFEVVHTNFAIR